MNGQLPDTPLDIIGDIHGEIDALRALLKNLGYDDKGRHLDGRSLVFVGDLVDRGPDSVGVVQLVQSLVESGRGFAILGNHELNLLRAAHKEGNAWFWAPSVEQKTILDFLGKLPLVLTRADIRVVHAAWDGPLVGSLAELKSGAGIAELFRELQDGINQTLAKGGWLEGEMRERAQWRPLLRDKLAEVPMLPNIRHCEEMRQNLNPLKVLTSGPEIEVEEPFFTNGKWRFLARGKWWEDYAEGIPVVMGHYWRQYLPFERKWVEKDGPNLFEGIAPTAWLGKHRKVFCVDFSVGARGKERQAGTAGEKTKLAALRWPEREMVLDTGEKMETSGE